LKLDGDFSFAAVVGLPRLPRRGPIEAAQRHHRRAGGLRLPRLPRRGPIEAIRRWTGWKTRSILPRLPRRGPIEADALNIVVGHGHTPSAAPTPRPH